LAVQGRAFVLDDVSPLALHRAVIRARPGAEVSPGTALQQALRGWLDAVSPRAGPRWWIRHGE
jgi:hypothetical protein